MKILLLAPSFPPALDAGGPVRALANLVAKHRSTHHFTVVCPDRDLLADQPFPGLSGRRVELAGLTIYYVDFSSPRQVTSIWGRLARQEFDLVLLNSLWDRKLSMVPLLLRRLGTLRGDYWVLAPRGELDPGALNLRSGRKAILGPIVRHNVARAIDAASATSDLESNQIELLLPGVPTTMATDIPDSFEPEYEPDASGVLRVVFVSRINPKKGLLRALQGLSLCSAPVSLTIYGPLEDVGYWDECQRAIADSPDHVKVSYGGVLSREEISGAFARSDVFLFPTFGENFGYVISESLQVGCPAIVTDTTPWSDGIRKLPHALLGADASPVEISMALEAWANRSPEELVALRGVAREIHDQWVARNVPDMIEALSLPT